MPRPWAAIPKNQVSPYKNDTLAGRVALVTGGGSGIGFECARQIGLHGGRLCLMGRRLEFLNKAAEKLRQEGIEATVAAGDVRRPEDCKRAAETAKTAFGSIDILINGAAGNFLATLDTLTPNGFKTVMEIDTQGAFNMCWACFPELKESKFGGNIINITATLHYGATWWQGHPSAAKAAIDSLTRSMALEWGDYGIRSNGIAPGAIADTPGFTKLSSGDVEAMAGKYAQKSIPTGRMGTKFDIAMACIYLCGAAGEYVSGNILIVDGAAWVHRPPSMPRAAVAATARAKETRSRAKM